MKVIALSIFILLSGLAMSPGREYDSSKWEQNFPRIVWVAYSPSTANPDGHIEATPEAITVDLVVLRKAGFTGLVTYSSSGALGRELPSLAKAQGFEGIIMGVWNPTSQEELAAAGTASQNPLVIGFCIGNEGLGHRYDFANLSNAIQKLRKETGKPVTTTETVEKYSNDSLLRLGDWVFPNAHPYFHGKLEPEAAVRWTKETFDTLKTRSRRFVMFKEVGLPTAGDAQARLSEATQNRYYQSLIQTNVQFVYFEAFDQPWKTHLPVEPHWGMFRSDRSPKLLALNLSKGATGALKPKIKSVSTAGIIPQQTGAKTAFYIYRDANSPDNHYKPTGYMGDVGDICLDEAFKQNPRSADTCIRIKYEPKGKSPNRCTYHAPCKWAGVYWQEPPGNWGVAEEFKNKGFDLSPYRSLKFWARADKPSVIEFKVGGIDQAYGDSLSSSRNQTFRLNRNWQEFEIKLKSANLRHIIGGFCWVASWNMNSGEVTFYLDDIRFEP